MRKLEIIGQKLKGKGQQLKGDIELKTGHRVRGSIDKIKGKANEEIADIRNAFDDRNNNI